MTLYNDSQLMIDMLSNCISKFVLLQCVDAHVIIFIHGYQVNQNARGGLFGHLGEGKGGANFFDPSS
jgi:hypothetical protein